MIEGFSFSELENKKVLVVNKKSPFYLYMGTIVNWCKGFDKNRDLVNKYMVRFYKKGDKRELYRIFNGKSLIFVNERIKDKYKIKDYTDNPYV